MKARELLIEAIKDKWFDGSKLSRVIDSTKVLRNNYYKVVQEYDLAVEVWDYDEDSKVGIYRYIGFGSIAQGNEELVEDEDKIAELEAAYCKRILMISQGV